MGTGKVAFEATGKSDLYDYEEGLISQIDSIDTKKFKWDIQNIKQIYEKNKAIYEKLSQETGFPPELICAIHYRESGCDFNSYLHNGDHPLGEPTRNYPAGKLFYDFDTAGQDALNGEKSKLKKYNISMSSDTKDMAAISAFAEAYNGLGYKNQGVVSPYIFSGTSVYTSGKYTSDNHYDPKAVDGQPGIYILVNALQN